MGIQNPVTDCYQDANGNSQPITATTPLPSTIVGNQVTTTDKSGTVTAGGSAQTIMAANANRRGFSIQNNSNADLWFSGLATAVATQPSMRLASGALYESPYSGVVTTAISLIGATTGQAFTAREW